MNLAFKRLSLLVLKWMVLSAPLPAIAAEATAKSLAPATPKAAPSATSLAGYQARLRFLDQLLISCQRAMTPANCKSDSVGPDLELALPSGSRQIRFAWLRDLLNAASDSASASASREQAASGRTRTDKTASSRPAQSESGRRPAPPNPAPVNPPAAPPVPEFIPPTLSQQLEDARGRLEDDSQWAAQASGAAPAHPLANRADTSPRRQALTRILAAKEYHAVAAGPSLLDRLLELVGNWLDRAIAKLVRAGFGSRWVGVTAEIVFVVVICIAIVWFLIRLERQGRLGPAFIRSRAGYGSASARDWQLWLEDAKKAAARGDWRDAIHLLYWASISRLESSGLWPADRARTPREYLAQLSAESTQHAELKIALTALTRSLERTWYAGSPAMEADFRDAEQLAARLGAQMDARPFAASLRAVQGAR